MILKLIGDEIESAIENVETVEFDGKKITIMLPGSNIELLVAKRKGDHWECMRGNYYQYFTVTQ